MSTVSGDYSQYCSHGIHFEGDLQTNVLFKNKDFSPKVKLPGT